MTSEWSCLFVYSTFYKSTYTLQHLKYSYNIVTIFSQSVDHITPTPFGSSSETVQFGLYWTEVPLLSPLMPRLDSIGLFSRPDGRWNASRSDRSGRDSIRQRHGQWLEGVRTNRYVRFRFRFESLRCTPLSLTLFTRSFNLQQHSTSWVYEILIAHISVRVTTRK